MNKIPKILLLILFSACFHFSFYGQRVRTKPNNSAPKTSNIGSRIIANTVHNLSVNGPGEIRANSESEICIFCHTPHNSSPVAPLWNKKDNGVVYNIYNSSTIDAKIGQPDGRSVLCLSCHDGTIALGNVLSRAENIGFSRGITNMPIGNSNLGTDLSDDHPISFEYDQSLSVADGQLENPDNLGFHVKLEDGKVQCSSCHDPHNNVHGNFLVQTDEYSALCVSCHKKPEWSNSVHRVSNAKWNGNGADPWFHSNYKTVAQNACENCHDVHSADGKIRLLKYEIEENNCFDCHNGNVAKQNIQSQFNKTYTHNVYQYNQIHDANEEILVKQRHVECSDCHNPHTISDKDAEAPNVKGANIGVTGINQSGMPVINASYEYEICYKCHSENHDKPIGSSSRVIEQTNVRLEFDVSNPSFHPVVGQGRNMNVPSLKEPISESSLIYCSDCHASDGKNSPNGPHGSIYPQLLKYNYNRDGDSFDMSYSGYELCYQCHDQNMISNSHSIIGPNHEKMTSCNTCHDPHGISSMQGNRTNNAFLINFNTKTVKENSFKELKHTSYGTGSGSCSLNCHGHEHQAASY